MKIPNRIIFSRQQGIAAVETAIAAPFLLFLMLAVAEITNAFTQYNVLVKTTQDAARYLASHATPGNNNLIELKDDQIAITKNLLVHGSPIAGPGSLVKGLETSMVSVTQFDANHISVTVDYPYQSIIGGTIPGFGFFSDISTNFTISTSSVMRAL